MGLFKIVTKPIGCILSLIGGLVVLAVLLIIGFAWAVDEMAPQIAESAITEATGFPTSVKDGSVSFRKQSFTLKDITIDNPEDFADRDFMRIGELTVGLDRKSWDADHIALSEITLIIDELSFSEGNFDMSNLDAFIEAAEENWALVVQQIHAAAAEENQTVPEKIVINQLNFALKRVKLVASAGDETLYRAIDLNYDKSFDNVDSLRPIIEAIAADLNQSGLPQVAGDLEKAASEIENDLTLKLLQKHLEEQYKTSKDTEN
ncbi:hypothetical protein [Cerasicoccus maritimus]|uniref:hypothetical protein n=1 Tax=Cerasicoccus maritimus TaxID=490089 RepID=UPI0028525AAB|nr:hypothetical protein [Cerasicoccus maritimus]